MKQQMLLKCMRIISQILEKILFFLIIITLILLAFAFNYYIQTQNELSMEELEQIVEKELRENI